MNPIFPSSSRIWALTFIIIIVACCTASAQKSVKGKRPNIVVILVDDMRWDEFGEAGHNYIKTPNIDRIAKEGANFIMHLQPLPFAHPAGLVFSLAHMHIPTVSLTTPHVMSKVTNLTHFQNNFMIMVTPLHSSVSGTWVMMIRSVPVLIIGFR